MEVIVVGAADGGLVAALEREGATVTQLESVVDRPALEAAGAVDASLFVVVDVGQATTIPIVHDLNDGIRSVVYASDTVPEFVRGQLDLALDPRLIEPSVAAEELTR